MTHKRIIQISTGHLGGAGIAARNLNRGLNIAGISSILVANAKKNFAIDKHEIAVSRTSLNSLVGKGNAFLHNQISSKSVFSIQSVSSNLKRIRQIAGDPAGVILHVHNWFNFINLSDIEFLLNKGYRFIFTLHDERMLTGGCHSTLSCYFFNSGCDSCPAVSSPLRRMIHSNFLNQERIFSRFHDQVTFVAPSFWISGQAQTFISKTEVKLVTINNYIPSIQGTQNFKNVSPKKVILGIANIDPTSYIKGGDRLQSLKNLVRDQKLEIEFLDMRLFSQSEDEKTKFWSAIDYLLILSRSENSPNIIFEAKGAGVPIIAPRVGGIPELLDGLFDIFADFENEEMLLSKLSQLHKLNRDSLESAEQKMWAHETATKSLNEHIKLYEELSR